MTLKEQLLKVAATYARARELSLARVSTLVFNEGKKIKRIEAGGDIGTERFESAMQWFAENWPDKAPWPAGVVRPNGKRPPARAHA
jgi:hypothetical protein